MVRPLDLADERSGRGLPVVARDRQRSEPVSGAESRGVLDQADDRPVSGEDAALEIDEACGGVCDLELRVGSGERRRAGGLQEDAVTVARSDVERRAGDRDASAVPHGARVAGSELAVERDTSAGDLETAHRRDPG